jgi:DNA-binding NarL/FixJ family response regulator
MERTRVLLADDHTMVRQGLAGILRDYEEFEVVAEAADGSEALEKALEAKPNVVVLDLSLPRLHGFEVARRIHKALPRARILVLTMHDEEEYVLKMVRAGASGYLVKDGAASELVAAIRALRKGQAYFGPQAAKALAHGGDAERSEDPYGSLTEREREIFHLLAEGRTNAQIAAVLCISPKTVDNHRTRLNEKLGVHSAAELLRYAAKHGLLA